MNVAVIWGHHRNDKDFHTHHTFWERSLRDDPTLKITRYIWPEMMDMPKDHDLYFFIDFVPELYRLWDRPFHPRIFYVWDAFHVPFTYPAQVTEIFDRSYFAEKNVVDMLHMQGIHKARWVPPAYYEGCYRPLAGVEKRFDMSFTGQPDNVVIRKGTTRKEFFEKFMFTSGLRCNVTQGVYGDDLNLIYNQSLICPDKTIFWNCGTRFFEVPGSGQFLLANRGRVETGMDTLAVDGLHFISYDDSYEDFDKKVRHYLTHADERIRIASAGHKFFYDNHRYCHRWHAILKDLGFEK